MCRKPRVVCRKPTVASTEIFGAEVGAASQSSNLREGHNSSQGRWAEQLVAP